MYDDELITPVNEGSVLDKLKQELSKKVRRPEIFLEVPERTNMSVRYSPNITQNQIRAWRRNSGEDTKNGMDATKFACYVLANTCTGIMIDKELVMDDKGNEVTFTHELLHDMLGVDRANDAIRGVYVVEPHIEATALAVMEAAGFNDTVEQVDPTKQP